VVAGGKGALEGRVTSASSHHRVPPAAGVMDENVHDRIKDMDTEGRDIDFLIPGTWATAASGLPDVTLAEALYRSYHNYIAAYCQSYPSRLRSMILVPAAMSNGRSRRSTGSKTSLGWRRSGRCCRRANRSTIRTWGRSGT